MAHKKGIYEKYIKRPQDFLCAAAATVVLSPVMGMTALLVRKKLGSPVLFTQDRPGLNGKIFKLYKFRSMTDERDAAGNLLPDDVRLTFFGKKLRSTSLDELPELFNILKGDMAVVGPRPLLVKYLPRYNEQQARRHEVRPGFTGLAQVHGRNAISWEEKFDWDVRYVDHISFLGDWKIIFETVKTVLKREGISAAGEATMGEFLGSTENRKEKKSVLILANDTGGLYSFRRELIMKLLEKHNVSFCTPPADSVIKLENLGCQYIACTALERRNTNPLQDMKLLHFYLNLIKQKRPDLLITYTIKPNIYGSVAARLCAIPYVANITGLGTSFENQGLLYYLVTLMYRTALKSAKKVFFENSANLNSFVEKRIIRKEQAYLLNGAGVNLEHFVYQKYPKNTIFKFLFIGRIMKEKGIEELLSAMQLLVRDGINCMLDVVGPFEEDYTDTINKAEAEGWLTYHGVQSDVRPFIADCDCFVLPSYHEGMANTNLECAACGRPIITSNIPGCKETVVDGSGLLCEPKNIGSLYESMKKMTEKTRDEREEMGKVGRKHMEEVFDKRKVVAETIKHLF